MDLRFIINTNKNEAESGYKSMYKRNKLNDKTCQRSNTQWVNKNKGTESVRKIFIYWEFSYYSWDFSVLWIIVSWTTFIPPWLLWLRESQSPSPAVHVGGCCRDVGKIICSSLVVFHWVSGIDSGWRNFLRLAYPPPLPPPPPPVSASASASDRG